MTKCCSSYARIRVAIRHNLYTCSSSVSHLITIDLHSGQCFFPFTIADESVILWGTITGVAIVVCASHTMPALFAISFAIIGALFGAVLAPHEVTFLAFPHLIAIIVLGDVTKHVALVACPTCRLSSGEERRARQIGKPT